MVGACLHAARPRTDRHEDRSAIEKSELRPEIRGPSQENATIDVEVQFAHSCSSIPNVFSTCSPAPASKAIHFVTLCFRRRKNDNQRIASPVPPFALDDVRLLRVSLCCR